ncbi:type VI secretion system Vgr family protein [Pseudoduganella armeniaca]|uniref:Type VI secretion system tip protein VgrG n=1 Tax=Pseudoduganella armeniaca TaxID=2072590 RepID=A0A2R4C3U6_9BURK|nr:type VI secretion system Vgr family protein [Pseudoduganella armeniaca]AVR94275.1 type VI secretion system tip protein VgrG [Pseudoduganella armeniaca]
MNALSDFLRLPRDLVTDNRPLRLRIDHPRMLMEDVLLPQRVEGMESICGGFEYRVLCVALDAFLPLKEFIALPAAIDFVTDTGELRTVAGIVTQACSGDSDGGLASYQVVIRDALAVMEKRINTRIFRNKNEVDIVQLLVGEWQHMSQVLATQFRLEVDPMVGMADYPQREFTMQHNESDAAFIRRLLKRRGINWHFTPDVAKEYVAHCMVLWNHPDSCRPNAAGTVRYHRDGATEERDSITSWRGVRTLQAASVTRHSWNYAEPYAQALMSVTAESHVRNSFAGVSATLNDYQVVMPHVGDSHGDLMALGTLAMQRHDYETKCFQGEGSVRAFRVGEYFTLADHAEIDRHAPDEREFIITELHVTARNNLPQQLAARVEGMFQRSRWPTVDMAGEQRSKLRFTAVRRGIDIVPAYDVRTDLPVVHTQSAVVVGPEGEDVHCDEQGRVKVRFPGTREQDHTHAYGTSGASDTERDSAWIRVASSWAGEGPAPLSQCGTVSLPRVGSEVLVTFLGGDPDKPVIVGQLYNGKGHPPALSVNGTLPGNRYLSGMRSKEVKQGGRGNQLRFDDTAGQISAQLASDHAESQLNLGYLTQPRRAGFGEERGQGAELRSQKHVAVRGIEGVLVTAESSDGKTGRHLDRPDLLRVAEGLEKLAKELAARATDHAGDKPDGDALAQLFATLRELEQQGRPVVALSGPAGIVAGSGANIALGAVTDIDVVSAKSTHVAAGETATIRAAQGLSLFANEGGAKLTAASGKVSIQAQDEQLELLAKKVLEIISTTDWITIKAKKGVRINGGGTELELSAGGIKGYTSGKHHMYAADHHTFPGQDKPQQFPGETPVHKICVPCLLIAAQAHSPFAPSK